MTLKHCETIHPLSDGIRGQLFPADTGKDNILSCKICITSTWPVKREASWQTIRTHQEPRHSLKCIITCASYTEKIPSHLTKVVQVSMWIHFKEFKI